MICLFKNVKNRNVSCWRLSFHLSWFPLIAWKYVSFLMKSFIALIGLCNLHPIKFGGHYIIQFLKTDLVMYVCHSKSDRKKSFNLIRFGFLYLKFFCLQSMNFQYSCNSKSFNIMRWSSLTKAEMIFTIYCNTKTVKFQVSPRPVPPQLRSCWKLPALLYRLLVTSCSFIFIASTELYA